MLQDTRQETPVQEQVSYMYMFQLPFPLPSLVFNIMFLLCFSLFLCKLNRYPAIESN